MQIVTAADFETYDGKQVQIKFTLLEQTMKEGTYNKKIQDLADHYNKLTKGPNPYTKRGDFIVSCKKLYVA